MLAKFMKRKSQSLARPGRSLAAAHRHCADSPTHTRTPPQTAPDTCRRANSVSALAVSSDSPPLHGQACVAPHTSQSPWPQLWCTAPPRPLAHTRHGRPQMPLRRVSHGACDHQLYHVNLLYSQSVAAAWSKVRRALLADRTCMVDASSPMSRGPPHTSETRPRPTSR
jgi:hypothetical protein